VKLWAISLVNLQSFRSQCNKLSSALDELNDANLLRLNGKRELFSKGELRIDTASLPLHRSRPAAFLNYEQIWGINLLSVTHSFLLPSKGGL